MSGKTEFKTEGYEMIEKTVVQRGTSGGIYLPVSWVGTRVKVIRMDMPIPNAVQNWDHRDIRELKAALDSLTEEERRRIDMTDLPSEPFPEEIAWMLTYPVWAVDRQGYCLVGDAADQIEHINSIRKHYMEREQYAIQSQREREKDR